MTDSSLSGLAVLLGIALYPFFANHLPNQRQNAAAVIGVVLLGFIILGLDRKSTRLNSSHDQISYAVFCLKKKNKKKKKKQDDKRIHGTTSL